MFNGTDDHVTLVLLETVTPAAWYIWNLETTFFPGTLPFPFKSSAQDPWANGRAMMEDCSLYSFLALAAGL
jgi:hypothetical protein